MREPNEILQILDHMGRPAGTADRGLANSTGLWHLCAQVWVVIRPRMPSESASVLFQRRGVSKLVNPGVLDASASGHVVLGQTSRQTAVQECAEELGLVLPSDDLLYLGRRVDMYEAPNVLSRVFADVYLAMVSADGLSLRSNPDEVDELAEIRIDELLAVTSGQVSAAKGILYSGDGTRGAQFREVAFCLEDFLPRHDWYYRKVAHSAAAVLAGRTAPGI